MQEKEFTTCTVDSTVYSEHRRKNQLFQRYFSVLVTQVICLLSLIMRGVMNERASYYIIILIFTEDICMFCL